MGHALIWVETLAAALTLVALVTAIAARWSWAVRLAAPLLVVLLLVVAAGTVTWGLGMLWLEVRAIRGYMFWYTLSLTATFAVGAAVLLVRGLRPGGEPAARSWSCSRLALALAVMVIVDGITVSNIDLAVQIQMAAVRTEAEARVAALSPPRPRDDENAGPVYDQAVRLCSAAMTSAPPEIKTWFLGWRDRQERVTVDPKSKDVRAFLDRQQSALALLRKAAGMPRYSAWLLAGPLLPQGESLYIGARLLGLAAVVRAADGDGRGALADVALCYRIARHVGEHRNRGSVVTAILLERDASRALEAVLALQPARADDLSELRLEPEESIRRDASQALTVEEAALAGSFTDVPWLLYLARQTNQVSPLARFLIDSTAYRVFFLRDDLDLYRRKMQHYEMLATTPYYKVLWLLDIDTQTAAANRGGILPGLILPAARTDIEWAARAEALRGMVRLAIAMTACRSKKGKYPDTLDALIPEYIAAVPTDPFDGQPLRMTRKGDEVVLYSVGLNQADDGGKDPDLAWRTGDITFRLR